MVFESSKTVGVSPILFTLVVTTMLNSNVSFTVVLDTFNVMLKLNPGEPSLLAE